jgi:hypothetical protein
MACSKNFSVESAERTRCPVGLPSLTFISTTLNESLLRLVGAHCNAPVLPNLQCDRDPVTALTV